MVEGEEFLFRLLYIYMYTHTHTPNWIMVLDGWFVCFYAGK
jgi:hypothetical protein